MNKPVVTGITVSVNIGEKNYGTGSESFLSLQGKYPDPGAVLDTTIEDGLDMYFQAWKSLIAGKYATGTLGGTEFKDMLAKAEIRLNKVRHFLKEEASAQ